MINRVFQVIKRPEKIVAFLGSKGFFKFLPDKLYLQIFYKAVFGKKLNLEDPKTFNEKLQWLKLYDREEKYVSFVDKYEAKKLASNIIGEKHIIPTIGIWERFDDIDFSAMPNSFVLKCTHDSGGIVICKDKTTLDIAQARKKINKSLKNNFFYYGREWPYKNIKPRIIAEKYMEDSLTKELRDYKFFCFNGKARFYKIDFDRYKDHRANYYDLDNNLLDLGETFCPPDFNRRVDIPSSTKQMEEYCTKMSKGLPFVRIDFYDVNGEVYFGEYTFFPMSGFGKFIHDSNDLYLGDMLMLPSERKKC